MLNFRRIREQNRVRGLYLYSCLHSVPYLVYRPRLAEMINRGTDSGTYTIQISSRKLVVFRFSGTNSSLARAFASRKVGEDMIEYPNALEYLDLFKSLGRQLIRFTCHSVRGYTAGVAALSSASLSFRHTAALCTIDGDTLAKAFLLAFDVLEIFLKLVNH